MLGSTRPPPALPTARDLMREWGAALRPDPEAWAPAAGLLDAAGAEAAPVVDSQRPRLRRCCSPPATTAGLLSRRWPGCPSCGKSRRGSHRPGI